MIQITDNIHAIKVPKDADDIEVRNDYNVCRVAYNLHGNRQYDTIDYNGMYKLLGEVTKKTISFDCKDLVNYCLEMPNTPSFKDYMSKPTDEIGHSFKSAADSFRSLLQSKGIELTDETKYLIIMKIN